MTNVTEYIWQIKHLKDKKEEKLLELNDINKKIQEVVLLWQDACEHPSTYVDKNGVCTACGKQITEIINE